MLQFTCECGHALKVSNDLAGWKTKCPGCKQLVSVPSPDDEPAPVEVTRTRSEASIPWKGIAIGASAVALIASIIAVASTGGSSKESESDYQSSRLNEKLGERDREIDRLRTELAKRGDSSRVEERLKAVEAERDKLRRELIAAQARPEDHPVGNAPANSGATSEPTPTAPASPPAAGDRSTEGMAIALSAEEIQEKYFGAVVTVATADGPASGFFIHKDGLVVTRYSAVAGSDSRLVSYVDEGNRAKRIELEAEVVAVDGVNDLALLKVSVPKLVPVVELESQLALGGGQNLTLIGPSPGTADFSLLRGKVVDVWRPAEGKHFIEMSIPITSAHAGAPVFNVMGRVVGVSKIPLETSTCAGLAVPAAHVHALVEGREARFLVKGALKDWESKKGATGGGFIASAEAPPGSILVDGLISKILIDEEKDRIVGLDIRGQGVVVMSISKRKALRAIKTGPQPVDLFQTVNPDVVWVGHSTSGNLVKVDLEEGRIFDRINIPGGYDHAAPTRNHVWGVARGSSFMLTLKDKQMSPVPFQFGGMTHDRRRDVLVAIGTYQGLTKMIEIDPDKMGPILRDIADIRANPTTHPKRKELPDLAKEFESKVKTWSTPPELTDWNAKGFRSRVTIDRSNRVIVNRTVLKREQLDSLVGTLPKERYSRFAEPGVREAIELFGSEFQPALACSPDGRWAATLAHVFDIENNTVKTELPIITQAVAFSEDSKKLYFYDLRYSAIVTLDVEKK